MFVVVLCDDEETVCSQGLITAFGPFPTKAKAEEYASAKYSALNYDLRWDTIYKDCRGFAVVEVNDLDSYNPSELFPGSS